jgi:hydrogenase nickel incorporation protein HypA/HybF
MHELSVTENILEIALRHAKQAEATRVTSINLVIGRLSSIVDDSIQFYWDFVSQDTICQGAKLNFERIPARLLCMSCGTEYVLESDLTACPQCQSAQVKILTGEEFRVDSIEIEKESVSA